MFRRKRKIRFSIWFVVALGPFRCRRGPALPGFGAGAFVSYSMLRRCSVDVPPMFCCSGNVPPMLLVPRTIPVGCRSEPAVSLGWTWVHQYTLERRQQMLNYKQGEIKGTVSKKSRKRPWQEHGDIDAGGPARVPQELKRALGRINAQGNSLHTRHAQDIVLNE